MPCYVAQCGIGRSKECGTFELASGSDRFLGWICRVVRCGGACLSHAEHIKYAWLCNRSQTVIFLHMHVLMLVCLQ